MQATQRSNGLAAATLIVVASAYLMFVVLGLPEGMLGVAWPSMVSTFGLQLGQMGTLLLAATTGFLITSFNAGRLIGRVGIVYLIIASCAVRGLGLLGMASAPEWPLLVAAAFVFGVGSGAIDAGMNTYFAINLSPRLMNWLHASFGLGATLGPILMTTLLSLGVLWRWGYVIVGIVQIAVAFVIFARAGAWQLRAAGEDEAERTRKAERKRLSATLLRPIVWVNIALFFFYAGTEVTAGNWSYTLFTEGRGIPVAVAGFWAGFYWGSFTIGRFVFGIVADQIKVVNAIRLMCIIAIGSAALIWWNPVDWVSFGGLAVLGFVMAPIFPLLVSATPTRLGVADANNAIGFQVAAASLGIAVLPGFAGILADQMHLEIIGPYLVMASIIMTLLHEIAIRGKSD